MIWLSLLVFALLLAWGWWMLPLTGSAPGEKLFAAIDDLHSELKARRLVKEARRELAERQGKSEERDT
jgi:hypothetical protein